MNDLRNMPNVNIFGRSTSTCKVSLNKVRDNRQRTNRHVKNISSEANQHKIPKGLGLKRLVNITDNVDIKKIGGKYF